MVQLSLPKLTQGFRRKNFRKRRKKNKIVFNVYRWNRESDENLKIDKFFIDKSKLGPMVLDALMFIKNKIDPSLTFRRSCREDMRIMFNERKWHKHSGLFETNCWQRN